MHVVDAARHIYDLSEHFCEWCFASSDDTHIRRCPSCARLTCRECVRLFEDGSGCMHTSPTDRFVLTRQDWNDD